MKENVQPITGCGTGDVAPYVFLAGDPDRVPKICERWTEVEETCRVREYVVRTGLVDGVRMTAASTGIGGPSTAVMVEELAKLGARTLIRIGNSGALADEVELGEVVISTAAVRDDGTSKSYVTAEYPAVADYEVVAELVAASRRSGHAHHVGLTWSVDGFYARNKVLAADGGLLSMSYDGYEQSWMNDLVADRKRARVLNVEMESAVIFTLANLFGLRAGCICTVSDRTPWPGPSSIDLDKNMHEAIDIAIEAMLALSRVY